jgi:hypothetical protein
MTEGHVDKSFLWIEEEGKWAYHDHDLESHDEKGDDADAGGNPCDYPFDL